MKLKSTLATLFALTSLFTLPSFAAERGGFGITVLVDGSRRPEYSSGSTLYIEAVKGREYEIRITNPLSCRVAVALSVDGLNSINAKHTDARSASKWVLGPYETITLSGWQINGSEARKFYFTGERQSYGALLGQTDNLGIIEAVFFREKVQPPPPPPVWYEQRKGEDHEGYGNGAPSSRSAPAPEAQSKRDSSASGSVEKAQPSLSDDYAATGIGRKLDHDVEWVSLDLERRPSAVVRLRYEFRTQLVKLGVLPAPRPCPDPLDRREHARGFSGGYCPDPYAGRN